MGPEQEGRIARMARDDNAEPGDYMRISQDHFEPESGLGMSVLVLWCVCGKEESV